MLPIILNSQNEDETQKYIQQFVDTYQIKSSNVFNFIPEKSELSMDEVRTILKLFFIQFPTSRVFIFHRFGNTSWEVQNMLLKVLEEKNDTNFIILIASNLYSILPTIRSRVKIVKIGTDDVYLKKDIPPLLDFLIKDKKRNPLFHDQLLNIKKDEALICIDDFIYYFSYQLRRRQSNVFSEILSYIFFIRDKIENNNLNVTLAMDNLLLFIEKKVSMNI